jgi:hypothetical protein
LIAFLAFLFLPLASSRCSRSTTRPTPRRRGAASRSIGFWATQRSGAPGCSQDSELLGSIWTSCIVALLGHAAVGAGRHEQRVSDRARPLSRQAGAVDLMLAPLVIPGRHPGHFDSRLRQPHRGFRR